MLTSRTGIGLPATARHTSNILLLAVALTCLLPNPAPVATRAESPNHAAQDKLQKEQLTFGENVSRQISPHEVHALDLQLSANQFLSLTLSPQFIDLIARVVGPDGAEVLNCHSRDYGSTPMSFIAESNGVYRVEITLRRTTSVSGKYSIRAEPPRRPAEPDRKRIKGERSFASGDALFARGDAGSLQQAVRSYEEAARAMEELNASVDQAAALKSTGQAYFRLGEYKSAIGCFRQALSLRKKIAGTAIEGEILNHLGYALIGIGDNAAGLSYCNQALTLFRRLRHLRGEAQVLTNLGEVYYAFSKLNQSLACYQDALPIWERLGDLRGQAQTLMNFGVTYSLLRDAAKSNDYSRKSIVIWKQINDRRGEGLSLTLLGTNYTRTAEWKQAGDVLYQALDYFKASGDRFGLARTYNCLAYLKAETGQPETAFNLYQQSLPLWVAIGHREAEAGTRRLLGQIYLDRGETELAMENLTRALQLARELRDPLMEGYALISLGNANHKLSRGREALANYRQALILFRAHGDPLREAMMLNSIGYIYLTLGNSQTAIQYFDRALPLTQAVNQRRELSATLYNLAQAEFARGNFLQARARIEEALRISETLRTKASSHEQRSAYFATVHKQYEFYVDLLMQLAKSQAREPLQNLALEVSERARARSLLDSLNEVRANIQANVDPALLEQERSLRDRLNEKAAQQMHQASSTEAAALKKEIAELTLQSERVAAQIRSSNPRYASLTQPQPLTVQQIQNKVLDDDAVLLEYLLGEKRSYVWAVTRTDVSVYELPPRAQIETAAVKFRELLTVNQPRPNESFQQHQSRIRAAETQFPAVAADLGDVLIAPVQQKLGKKRLLIVTDGALHYIPFQALMIAPIGNNPANGVERVPLLFDHEIVYEPSASALALVTGSSSGHKPPNSIAVFANPVFEADDPRVRAKPNTATEQPTVRGVFRDLGFSDGRVPALPSSREEAEAIMSFAPWGTGLKALGFEANRTAVTKPELAQYRIVHFATHGFVDYERPELSGLVLSLVDRNGQPQEGYLRLHDIYNLNLSADLVVLSACNTGLGKEIKGEGLIGLTRGFMYAGVGGVAASLWKVDDDATAELMTRFYEGMFKRGLTPSAAMRDAQLSMWQQTRWRAPYYWAAFVIQGRYDQTQTVGFSSSRAQWIVTSAGLGSAFLLAACMFFSRRRSCTL